jgi:hypothetical protein
MGTVKPSLMKQGWYFALRYSYFTVRFCGDKLN